MRSHEGIHENLRFLIIEIEKQLERTARYLRNPNKALARKVVAADDYIDNLKTIIQRKSFSAAAEALGERDQSVDYMRTFEALAANLERIADFCEKVLDQVGHIDRTSVRERYDFNPFIDVVMRGVGLIEGAVFQRDVRLALSICRTEHTLDQMYAKAFRQILSELKTDEEGEETQTLVTVLFIAHYLERMGDSLLNIGEAILSSHLGERIKIDQLRTLEGSLDKTDIDSHLGRLRLNAMGETKSGARVASLSVRPPRGDEPPPEAGPSPEASASAHADGSGPTRRRGGAARSVIFKEGKTNKLIEERDSITRWEQLMPGLAPKIYSFHDAGEDGAILFEYLSGRTFESMLFGRPSAEVHRALDAIQRKLVEVWNTTRRPEPAKPRFIAQLEKRFDDVLAVHPEFDDRNARIGGFSVKSFSTLMSGLRALDDRLAAPFSVFIHGDFNVDNVIYDARHDSVRFIDLHRSTMMDYTQDISVFLVSHFRLQVLDGPARRRIRGMMRRFYEFAGEHAERIGDSTFHVRLALGMARSLATSTRFVLDQNLARDMFLRSRYLLERLIEAEGNPGRCAAELTREVLVE